MRQSYTAVVERNTEWSGPFSTEPYEAAWASEAVFFVRVLHASAHARPFTLRVQISPDGMHWVDEGSTFTLTPSSELAFCRVAHFGGWLRLVGETPRGESLRVLTYLSLKS